MNELIIDLMWGVIFVTVFWVVVLYFGAGRHHGIRAHTQARKRQDEICKKADDDTIDDDEWDNIIAAEIKRDGPVTEGLLRAHDKRERRHAGCLRRV